MSTLHRIAFDVDMNIVPPVHTTVGSTINPSDSWQYAFKINLRSRHLEVVGTRKNWRARRRHAKGEGAHPSRVSLARAFSLSPTASKRLLRRLIQDRRGAALLLYRNRSEINVIVREQKTYPIWFSCRRNIALRLSVELASAQIHWISLGFITVLWPDKPSDVSFRISFKSLTWYCSYLSLFHLQGQNGSPVNFFIPPFLAVLVFSAVMWLST